MDYVIPDGDVYNDVTSDARTESALTNQPLTDQELANLTDSQRQEIDSMTAEGQRCLFTSWQAAVNMPLPYCEPVWDGLSCWPATPPNTTVLQPCPLGFRSHPDFFEAVGHRTCNASGMWENATWTNYTLCWDVFYQIVENLPPPPDESDMLGAILLRDIYFAGSILSLILLVIALFIFSYFKSLHCSRISIHKHLVVSFILRSTVLVVMFEPYVTDRQDNSYRNIDWLCKTLFSLCYYSMIANTAWMFVEGLFLHSRLTVSVFQQNDHDSLHLYYIIGWGLPVPVVVSWAICMHLYNRNNCWNRHFQFRHTWIIMGPIITLLAINLLFLISIVRIVVTKLRANGPADVDNKIRAAVRALLFLFPLLGLNKILFPMTDDDVALAYRVTNAVLQSSEGIFVAVIYCFLNQEVRSAISRKWYQSVQLRAVKRMRKRSCASVSNLYSTPSTNEAQRHRIEFCPASHLQVHDEAPSDRSPSDRRRTPTPQIQLQVIE